LLAAAAGNGKRILASVLFGEDTIVFDDQTGSTTERHVQNLGDNSMGHLHFSQDGSTLIVVQNSGWKMLVFDCGASASVNDIGDQPTVIAPIVTNYEMNFEFDKISFSGDCKKLLLWDTCGWTDDRVGLQIAELSSPQGTGLLTMASLMMMHGRCLSKNE